MTWHLPAAIAAIATAAIAASPAHAESGRLADFTMRLSSKKPGTPTGFHTQFRLRQEGHPDAKPSPIRSATIRLPKGLRFDSGAVPQCKASDAELHVLGTGACPADSQLTVGPFTAMTGFGPPIDPVEGDDHVFNGPDQIIEVITAPGTPFSPGFDRLTISGSTLTAHPPKTPGGPPDGETAVRSSDFAVPVRTAAGRSLVTTPPKCPKKRRWMTSATFRFANGDSDTVLSATPCKRRRVRR
jgi:hypothetical protein